MHMNVFSYLSEQDAHLSCMEQRASEHVGQTEEVQILLDYALNGTTEKFEDFPGENIQHG